MQSGGHGAWSVDAASCVGNEKNLVLPLLDKRAISKSKAQKTTKMNPKTVSAFHAEIENEPYFYKLSPTEAVNDTSGRYWSLFAEHGMSVEEIANNPPADKNGRRRASVGIDTILKHLQKYMVAGYHLDLARLKEYAPTLDEWNRLSDAASELKINAADISKNDHDNLMTHAGMDPKWNNREYTWFKNLTIAGWEPARLPVPAVRPVAAAPGSTFTRTFSFTASQQQYY